MRGTAALITRTIGLQALGFVAFIGLARLISPADLGLFTLAVGVQEVCLVLVSAGLPASLVRQDRYPTAEEQRAIAGFSLLVAVVIAAVAVVASFVVLPAAGVDSKAAELIAIACLALPIFATRVTPIALLNRNLNFERIALIDVVTRIALYVWALGGAALGFGVYALVSAIPASSIVSAALASRWQPWARGVSLDLSIVAEHARFGLKVAGVRLLVHGFPFSAVTAFALFSGPALAGFYGLSRRALGLPFSAVGAVRRVGFPALSRLEPRARSRQAGRAIAVSAVAVSAPLAVLVGSAEPLVATLFGSRWLPAAEIMILSAPGLLVYASLGSAIASKALADGDVRIPAIAISLQIGVTVGLAALLADGLRAEGAGIAMGTGYLVYGLVLFAIAGDAHVRRAAWVVVRAAFAGALAAGAARALGVDEDFLGLAIAASVSAAVWLGAILLVARRELVGIVALLRRHIGRRPEDLAADTELETDPAAVA